MITEDYVSFETAKLLKKKGFPQTTFRCHYIIDGNAHYKSFENRCGFGDYDIIAPTLQMAMKWLLKKYNIFICVLFLEESNEFGYTIEDIIKKKYITTSKKSSYKEPEEACEAAIKYCLEKLI